MKIALDGRVALVTGSASGIGAATAMRLADAGARVIVADINGPGAETVRDQIRAKGGEAEIALVDIADPSACAKAIAGTVAQFGRLDILHNNAAAFGPDGIGADSLGDILTIDPKVIDHTMAVNVNGYINMLREAVPVMLSQGGGAIVNTSSVGSYLPDPARQAYSISKAAVNMLTREIATTYGKQGIRCNAVCPGIVVHGTMEQEFKPYMDVIKRHLSVPELGAPDDIAHIVVFLVSDQARYINGTMIAADGGLYSSPPQAADVRDLTAS